MIIQHDKSNLQIGESVRDGDFDARLVKVYIKDANLNTVIEHKLGRIPRHIDLTWKDGFLDFAVCLDATGSPMIDTEKVVLKFSAANVTAVIRFA